MYPCIVNVVGPVLLRVAACFGLTIADICQMQIESVPLTQLYVILNCLSPLLKVTHL